MNKTYCKDCKHYETYVARYNNLPSERCNAPDNLKFVDTYLKEKIYYKKKPNKKNKYNDCKSFELK